MFKKIASLILCLSMLLSVYIPAFAAVPTPTSLEAPQNASVRYDGSVIRVRWIEPKSIVDLYTSAGSTTVVYEIDWHVNDGAWKSSIADDKVHSLTDSFNVRSSSYYTKYAANVRQDELNGKEDWFSFRTFGNSAFDFKNNTYYFRVRYIYQYKEGTQRKFLASSYSAVVAYGKDAQSNLPKSLDAPTGLKGEQKTRADGSPYFGLSWEIPAATLEANKLSPVSQQIDWKLGDGKWASEGGGRVINAEGGEIASSTEVNPLDQGGIGAVDIKSGAYTFRVRFMCKGDGQKWIYSPWSNEIQLNTPEFYFRGASSWSIKEMNQALEMGLITAKIRDNLSGPITREEFAEIAVIYYEKITGKKAEPAAVNPFNDCTNPEVLKAFSLKITTGVGDGTKFMPNNLLTRQQMAAMITRTLQACYSNVVIDVSDMPDFKDQTLIENYANKSTKFLAKFKITLGDGKGNFQPRNNCTREQAVAFLVRAFNYKDQYVPR